MSRLDIDASVRHSEPDYVMIEGLAAECRMPFCYGGGVKTVAHARRISRLGVEEGAYRAVLINYPNQAAKAALTGLA